MTTPFTWKLTIQLYLLTKLKAVLMGAMLRKQMGTYNTKST